MRPGPSASAASPERRRSVELGSSWVFFRVRRLLQPTGCSRTVFRVRHQGKTQPAALAGSAAWATCTVPADRGSASRGPSDRVACLDRGARLVTPTRTRTCSPVCTPESKGTVTRIAGGSGGLFDDKDAAQIDPAGSTPTPQISLAARGATAVIFEPLGFGSRSCSLMDLIRNMRLSLYPAT